MKYQTKLVFVAALALSYDTAEAMQTFIGTNGDVRAYEEHDLAVLLDTPDGLLVAKPTDYVVKSEDGTFSVHSEHSFINRFEAAGEFVDIGAALTDALQQAKIADGKVDELAKALSAVTTRAENAEKLAEALKKQLDAKPAPAAAKPA
jgi:hypothetical protein